MMSRLPRRMFLGTAALAISARKLRAADPVPAILGGTPALPPARRSVAWPIIGENDVTEWLDVLRSGAWNRLGGDRVDRFEAAWAERLGAKHALATANGTSALTCALNALGVGPGDEVIVPPYTFAATVNAVLMQHALPVFVDTDPKTFQIDASRIESALTDRTRAIIPVHVGGAPADLDAILDIAKRHDLPVIEDACQAHLAEWRGRAVGTLGACGCFSFQASKNLNCGEGGALVTGDEEIDRQARSFQNNGRAWAGAPGQYARNGANLRLTEFQGALLSTQMGRLEDQSRTRERNAARLTERLEAIGGLVPVRPHDGCTRNAYHLYMCRYGPEAFAGLPRAKFLEALAAEGVGASPGYGPLNREPFLAAAFATRGFRRVYGEGSLADRLARTVEGCPVNDRVCTEAVWLTQTTLLGSGEDMDAIAQAVEKIKQHAGRIAAS